IFYNFEHPDNFRLTDAQVLYEEIQAKVKNLNGKIYFIFDEIQEVKNWQKLINGLRVAFDSDIYITGSNANLLSGELATYLAGRYIELQVYPLSFAEFKMFNDQLSEQNPDVLFREYLRWGGFPALPTIQDEKIKGDILDGIYTSIILKDVAARGEIREISLLDQVTAYLLDTIGSIVSRKKISDAIKAEGIKTNPTSIDKYIELLKESFVFYEAPRYDIRGKQRLKTLAKYYTVDTGIRNNTLGRIGNVGSQLENIIYIELKRRNYEVFVGKFDSTEIDFVCFKNGKVEYFQIAYQLPQGNNREQKNLLNIADNYQKTIISLNRMDVGNIDGIPVVYAVDWLLGEDAK
ncbi:MAG: ATP-binding protein, partial [Lactobacillales bacterium]|nr:ATP-binding protein [Lactobacillales bacterium]